MDILSKMNGKMDQGYKVTNIFCTFCNGVLMMKVGKSQVYCPKCNKQYIPQQQEDQQSDQIQNNYQSIIEEYNKKKNNSSRSDEISKKMGEKLIQGWAMLDETCLQCNVPLMKSKKGQKICFSCNKNYAVTSEKVKQKPVEMNEVKKQVKQEKKEVKEKQLKDGKCSERIEQMLEKTTTFLEVKLEKVIQQNDMNGVEKVLELLQKVKKMI